MISIVIAEDQSLLRGALASLLSIEDDIEVVAQAADGLQAIEMVSQHTPDVLLTDICLLYTSPSPRDQRGSRMPSSA